MILPLTRLSETVGFDRYEADCSKKDFSFSQKWPPSLLYKITLMALWAKIEKKNTEEIAI